MDKQQASWLIVRAFGLYLLIQAFMLGLGISSEVYIYASSIKRASSLGTENTYVSAILLTYRSSLVAGLLKFVLFSAAGIYLLRRGQFLMRWLQYVPNNPTEVGGEGEGGAEQIVGRESQHD
jgi:ABC-type sulfate transport system permease component